MDVRVVAHALEMRPEELVRAQLCFCWFAGVAIRMVCRRGSRVDAEVIVAQPGLACPEGKQQVPPPCHEARVCDVAEQLRRRRQPRKCRLRRREELGPPAHFLRRRGDARDGVPVPQHVAVVVV